MKVYILYGSFGQYADHYIDFLEAHSDPIKAEERKRFIEDDSKYKKDNPPLAPSLHDDEAWGKYLANITDIQEFNSCYIKEMNLIN